MSPTAFKDQHTTYISTLNNCHDYCQTIRTNRRLGNKPTPNFDSFQTYIITSKQNLAYTFTTLRAAVGSRFELGDTISRTELDRAIRSLQAIQSKLSDIAYSHDKHVGFQELHYQLRTLEAEILSTFSNLKYRLELAKEEAPKPKPILKKTKTDDVVISMKKLDMYIEHMKNSWTETELDGKVYYVNVYDPEKRQWEKPKGGFIQSLPKKEKPKAPKRREPTFWEIEAEKERIRQEDREADRLWEEEKEREERERRRRRMSGW